MNDNDKLQKELEKKLNTIRYDLLVKHYSELSHDFFYVAVVSGTTPGGLTSYKQIDLLREFPDVVKDFCKRHSLKFTVTKSKYRFDEALNGQA